jgi:hypothetical protein
MIAQDFGHCPKYFWQEYEQQQFDSIAHICGFLLDKQQGEIDVVFHQGQREYALTYAIF